MPCARSYDTAQYSTKTPPKRKAIHVKKRTHKDNQSRMRTMQHSRMLKTTLPRKVPTSNIPSIACARTHKHTDTHTHTHALFQEERAHIEQSVTNPLIQICFTWKAKLALWSRLHLMLDVCRCASATNSAKETLLRPNAPSISAIDIATLLEIPSPNILQSRCYHNHLCIKPLLSSHNGRATISSRAMPPSIPRSAPEKSHQFCEAKKRHRYLLHTNGTVEAFEL